MTCSQIDTEAVQSQVAQPIAVESLAHHLLRELALKYDSVRYQS